MDWRVTWRMRQEGRAQNQAPLAAAWWHAHMADDEFAEAPVGAESRLQEAPGVSPSVARTPSATRSKRLYAIRAAEIQMQNREARARGGGSGARHGLC